MRESKLQAEIRDSASKIGWIFKNNHGNSYVRKGWPDIELYGFKGIHLLLELKVDDNTMSTLQRSTIEDLVFRGHLAGCLTYKDGILFLESCTKEKVWTTLSETMLTGFKADPKHILLSWKTYLEDYQSLS